MCCLTQHEDALAHTMPSTPPLPVDPFVTVTQHGAALRLNSNLQALPLIRQLLLQGADLALLEQLKVELQGRQGQIVVPMLHLAPGGH